MNPPSSSTRTFPIRSVQRVGVTLIIPLPTVIIMQLRSTPLNAITINKSHVMSAPRSCRPWNSINKAGGVRVSIVSGAACIRTLPNLGGRMGPRSTDEVRPRSIRRVDFGRGSQFRCRRGGERGKSNTHHDYFII